MSGELRNSLLRLANKKRLPDQQWNGAIAAGGEECVDDLLQQCRHVWRQRQRNHEPSFGNSGNSRKLWTSVTVNNCHLGLTDSCPMDVRHHRCSRPHAFVCYFVVLLIFISMPPFHQDNNEARLCCLESSFNRSFAWLPIDQPSDSVIDVALAAFDFGRPTSRPESRSLFALGSLGCT